MIVLFVSETSEETLVAVLPNLAAVAGYMKAKGRVRWQGEDWSYAPVLADGTVGQKRFALAEDIE